MVPPSGNMSIGPQQFWLGPARAGRQVRFWIDTASVHLSIGGWRIKTVPSRLTGVDLARLRLSGGPPGRAAARGTGPRHCVLVGGSPAPTASGVLRGSCPLEAAGPDCLYPLDANSWWLGRSRSLAQVAGRWQLVEGVPGRLRCCTGVLYGARVLSLCGSIPPITSMGVNRAWLPQLAIYTSSRSSIPGTYFRDESCCEIVDRRSDRTSLGGAGVGPRCYN